MTASRAATVPAEEPRAAGQGDAHAVGQGEAVGGQPAADQGAHRSDPGERDGRLVLELHGIRNEAVTSRTHLRLTRRTHETWHRYRLHQYEQLWHQSRPLDPTPGTGPGPAPAPGPAPD
ncbi:hypothetical protein ACIQCF_14560 [Streptomyces sp. NPDC088353]|uniref:hypothetical protein n=1 Tax=Streptomyces sp. NPDC088353 TaxID=3365855 RepID=UPI003825F625